MRLPFDQNLAKQKSAWEAVVSLFKNIQTYYAEMDE
jgi:hypothetical protein